MATLPPALAVWSRKHAIGVTLSAPLALWTRSALPLVAWALGSFAWLIALARGTYTPRGEFGAANGVTLARLLLVLSLAFAPRPVLAALAFAILLLDWFDGFVARKTASVSAFGGHFDMETDAMFTLFAGLELWLRGRLGLWIVVPGLLRYLYVVCLYLIPPRHGEVARSRFGRLSFFSLAVGLIAPWLLPGATGNALALWGAAAVSASFLFSFKYSYAKG